MRVCTGTALPLHRLSFPEDQYPSLFLNLHGYLHPQGTAPRPPRLVGTHFVQQLRLPRKLTRARLPVPTRVCPAAHVQRASRPHYHAASGWQGS